MLTAYGNWYYPDEDPLAKRRKTSKGDSSRAKEQTGQTTDGNEMTRSNKPFLAVRNLIGDRLSVQKSLGGNSTQGGDVFTNVNNPCYIQGYSIPDPRLMFGVRDVRNVWPGRVQFPNEPPRYEYRPSTIARPYPLRIRPVFSSFPIQLAHTGWVRASVTSAFSPVRHVSPEIQTPTVTTQSVTTAHSSSIQSLSQMVSSVTASTSTSLPEALSAKRDFSPARITTSGSPKSETSKSTAQPITTTPQSPIQARESPKLQPSHIPVQTIMYSHSSSLRASGQTACFAATTTETNSSAVDLSIKSTFTTSRIISSGSTTPPTSIVTTQPVMATQSSPIQSSSSMVGSDAAATSTLSTEAPSAKSDFSAARIISSGSSQFQNSKTTAQPISTTPPPSIQSQESPTRQPSHIPVQTIMFSPSSSLQVANQTSCSATTTSVTVTTSTTEELSPNNAFSTARIISSGPLKSDDSKPTAQPPSLIQSRETSTFQPSHIPVQTIMYSPASSHRAVSKSFCPVTTTVTTAVKISSDEEHSPNSALSTARTIPSISQTPMVTTQPVMTSHSSSVQTQESKKFQPSHIPVQTIMYSPASSLRATRQTACSVTTTATTSFPEDLSTKSSFTTTQIISSGSSKSQAYKPAAQPMTTTPQSSIQPQETTKFKPSHIPVQTIMYSPSSSLRAVKSNFCSVSTAVTNSSPEDLSIKSAYTTTRIISTGSSTSQTSLVASHPVVAAHSSSIQSQSSMVGSVLAPTTNSFALDLTVNSAFRSNRIMSSGSSQSQDFMPTAQPSPGRSKSSQLSPEIITISSPSYLEPEESSECQTSIPNTTIPLSSVQPPVSSNCQISQLLLLSPPTSLQSSEQSHTQNSQLTKLLLTSPPISQIAFTAPIPTTTSPPVISNSIGGESLCETALDVEETVIQSVVGSIKVNIPKTISNGTSKTTSNTTSITTIRRTEDEIEEKDALLKKIYSVPVFGGKTIKNARFYEEMLTKPKLCHLFKCMASECSFTCNKKTSFDKHIEMHEAQGETQKESSRIRSENDDDEGYDWQQCAYCCDSPTYPSLGEHLLTEHGYCLYQCAYCFYRALFQNYVDIHQVLAHRKILQNNPRVIYKCKALSEVPTVTSALKKIGRRRCVRPYHCDQCGSEFLITEEFMNHLLKEHQSVTSYTCHICKNVCFKPDRLVVHYNLHSYSTYQCPYCLHGTETERKMFFHLCTNHFDQPACLYVRAWEEGKPVQSEDKPKKLKNRAKFTNQLESLKMISYDIEAIIGHCTLEDASDDENADDDRLVIDESQELNDIIAELGIATETEPSEVTSLKNLQELASIGKGTAQNVPVSALLPNARFSLEGESGAETFLISSGSSSN